MSKLIFKSNIDNFISKSILIKSILTKLILSRINFKNAKPNTPVVAVGDKGEERIWMPDRALVDIIVVFYKIYLIYLSFTNNSLVHDNDI